MRTIRSITTSSLSVPSNIAEGQKHLGHQETVQFTGIALSSTAEVETQLLLVRDLYEINVDSGLQLIEEISKMISGLIRALR